MSDPIGTYTFLPWVRRGIANRIAGVSPAGRATFNVRIGIEGAAKNGGTAADSVTRAVQMFGPGDIVGIEPEQISRMEPENWVTNFEPNYLAAIEFYDEDFLWRYSPAAPAGRRLLPWLALVVLEESEFKEGAGIAGRPLPFVELTADFDDVFSKPEDTWAWGHAQFNAAFSAKVMETDSELASAKADDAIQTEPDVGCCRLLCPRKLKPKTSYHAFLVPAFESGRLSGLGLDPNPVFEHVANGLTATSSAWGAYATAANRPEPGAFPIYHRWTFRTADRGDFESLVRLLRPQVVDSRVGHRDMDVSDPAPNIEGIETALLGRILRLGGALKAPFKTLDADEKTAFLDSENWASPYPHRFQRQLAAFVNLADSYQRDGAGANADEALSPSVQDDPLPLVTPPLYGRWHAMSERLLTGPAGNPVANDQNWVHDLNLDPRWRVAAGFGTKVIQQNQEAYMEAAWDQIGDVLEANRRIRAAQLAEVAGHRFHQMLERAAARSTAGAVMLSAPLSARVISQGVTLRHAIAQSPAGVALTSVAMRRAVRPRSKATIRLGLNDPPTRMQIVARAHADEITAAPDQPTPERLLTPDAMAQAAGARNPRAAAIGRWIRANPILAALILLALILLSLIALPGTPGLVAALALVGGAAALWRGTANAVAQVNFAHTLSETGQTPDAVSALPGAHNFVLIPDADPMASTALPPGGGGADSVEAARFKEALGDQYRVIEASRALAERPAPRRLNLASATRDMLAAVDPRVTVPRWTLSGLSLPGRIRDQMGDDFVEAMAYPEFDTPMYEPLARAGDDLFVPNLHLVPPDSVTLLETNQKFIEAYMVGLNHEFARELLWREYPTDQRGSYFRQFWDVRKKIAQAADKAAARERLKDIKPIHRWPSDNDLGDNDNREVGQVAEEELVLVIRGELLKKYPNTVISAQPAAWQLENGKPNKAVERVFDTSAEPIAPLYEARVAPDIYFFGFDLTAEEARGDDTVDDRPGWFFRIEEVAGDARFGFDIARQDPSINVWNDLAWQDVFPGLADGDPLDASSIAARTLTEPNLTTQPEKHAQWGRDQHVPLNGNLSAAELAYISLQTPVIMAVHAAELLPDQEASNG
ncbi:MAG: hypothetical protein QNJ44_08850 [Rhodobacter sp.]|nr:hypothetical protein [Rhodobacter sp.]